MTPSISREFRTAFLLTLAMVLGGTCGYMYIEDYDPVEAIYMTVITVTTVGYGEVRPLSQQGRVFTALLILGGLGVLAYFGQAVADRVVSQIQSDKAGERKMKKQISKLSAHYIVCGFGGVGHGAVQALRQAGVSFVVLEMCPESCAEMREKGILHIEGNATSEELLLRAGIKRARGLLALLHTDPDNLFVTLTARELNPTLRIISRCEGPSSEKKLMRAGADSTMAPFATAGMQIASDILAATGESVPEDLKSSGEKHVTCWIDVLEGSSMVGRSIENLANEMDRKILGLRRSGLDCLLPETEKIVLPGDRILTLGDPSNELEEGLSSRNVVIVDDNPVVLNLYIRLLRRSGFHPIPAGSGQEALEIIRERKPDAAVVDLELPFLSGIEVCESVRQDPSLDHIRLILFTSDESEATRERALQAGATEVVIKGAESAELIDAVIRLLRRPPSTDHPSSEGGTDAEGRIPEIV